MASVWMGTQPKRFLKWRFLIILINSHPFLKHEAKNFPGCDKKYCALTYLYIPKIAISANFLMIWIDKKYIPIQIYKVEKSKFE